MKTPFLSRARDFAGADDGLAAIEMAFVFPVAVILMSLIVASGQSLNAWRRTNAVAHTVTDLVSRTPDTSPDASVPLAEDIKQSDLLTDLSLSQLVMWPSDPTNLQIVMTQVLVNPSNNLGSVVWSQGYNGATPLPCYPPVTLNSNLSGSGAVFMLVGSVSYSFQPLGVELNLPTMSFSATEFLTIRYARQIVVTNVTNATSFNQCS